MHAESFHIWIQSQNEFYERMKKTRLSRRSRAKKRKHEKSKYLRKSVSNAELLRNQTLEKSMIEILPFYAILFFVSLLLFECFERFCSLMPAYLSLSLSFSFSRPGSSVRIEFVIQTIIKYECYVLYVFEFVCAAVLSSMITAR